LGNAICVEEPYSLPEELFNHWIHSHEEDTKDIRVFRPSTYDFPRSRVRRGFEIKKNGEFVEYRIAPTDALLKLSGHWKLVEKNKITVEFDDKEIEPYTITIISIDQYMLKIKK
jgi:hypothetical protein